MKKTILLLLICFGFIQVKSYPNDKSDDGTFVRMMDSLSVALVKQDKEWLKANLSDDCNLSDPAGQILAKEDIIKAFSPAGVYTLTKMKASNMKYTIDDLKATGAGSIEIEGAMSNGEVIDISGSYNIQADFKKTESGWKITSIRVSH